MPKTFTNDVSQAFPSLVVAPFTIADADAPGNAVRLDPGGDGLVLIGTARPAKTIVAAATLAEGSTVAAKIGAAIAARRVGSGFTGSVATGPFRIPDDMDLSEPSYASFLIHPNATSTINGQKVRLDFEWTRVRSDGTYVSGIISFDWPVPDNWATSQTAWITPDAGSGATFDAGTFSAGELVGFRCQRDGAHAADTFNKALNIAEAVHFRYTSRLL